jgi:hypothetical protein
LTRLSNGEKCARVTIATPIPTSCATHGPAILSFMDIPGI